MDATDAPRRERRAVLPSRSLATTRPLAPYTPSRDTGGVFTRIRRVRRVDEPPGGDVRSHDRRHRLAARVHGVGAVRAGRQRDLPPGPKLQKLSVARVFGAFYFYLHTGNWSDGVFFVVDRLSSPPRRSCGPYFSYSEI